MEKEFGSIKYISGEDSYSNVKTIEAIAKNGYSFAKWAGDIDNANLFANPLTIQYANGQTYKRIIALFKKNVTYTLTVKTSLYGHNTVIDFEDYPQHKQALAEPIGGYMFKEWVGDAEYITSSNKNNNPIDISMVDNKRTTQIEAIYEEDPSWTKIQKVNGDIQRIYVEGPIELQHLGRDASHLYSDTTIKIVHLGTAVDSIGEYCFANCENLQEIHFSQLEAIEKYALFNTKIASLDVQSIKSLSEYSCAQTMLQSINDFNKSTSDIPIGCFYGCQSLTSIALPETVQSIKEDAFGNCKQLALIDLRSYQSIIPEIYSNTFDACGTIEGRQIKLYSVEQSQKVYDSTGPWHTYYADVVPQVEIKTSSTKLTFNAKKDDIIEFRLKINGKTCNIDFGDGNSQTFRSNIKSEVVVRYTSPKQMVNPVEIKNVAYSIKVNDEKCIKISLSDSIRELPDFAFKGTRISRLTIPATIQTIGQGILQNCESITLDNVILESSQSSTRKIPNDWIVVNGGLVNLFMSNTTESFVGTIALSRLDNRCFTKSSSITQLSLPMTLNAIGQMFAYSDQGFPNLDQIEVHENNVYFTSIDGCLIETLDSRGKVCLTTNSVDNIPDTSKEIMPQCFAGNSSSQISLPSTVTIVNPKAFFNCYSLQTIVASGISVVDAKKAFDSKDSWIYGGVDFIEIADDMKQSTRDIQVNCEDGSFTVVAVTGSIAYLLKELQPSKVKVLTMSNDYSNDDEWQTLPNATNDSNRIESLLNGFSSSIIKLQNSSATKSALIDYLTDIASSVDKDDLLVIHVTGLDGEEQIEVEAEDTSKDIAEDVDEEPAYEKHRFLCLYGHQKMLDTELFDLLKIIPCRIVVLICCANVGEFEESTSWTNYVQDYFYSIDTARLLFISACDDGQTSYVDSNGHCFVTSIIDNFNRSNKKDSYDSLFYNATTSNEPSVQDKGNGSPSPTMQVIGQFNPSIRAFT